MVSLSNYGTVTQASSFESLGMSGAAPRLPWPGQVRA